MALLYRTKDAAQYCTSLGRPVSPATLRKLRLKGPDDPGNRGPAFLRDPNSDHCLYSDDVLRTWVDEWTVSLTTAQIPRAAHLARASDGVNDPSP
jgi:hypothetical protein